jgi:Virulence factor
MAQVRVMYWKEIPYAVRASEGSERASRSLPQEFQEAVDAAAMTCGETSQEAYQAGFAWGPTEERPGTPAEIADRVVAEIIAAYPRERLLALTRSGGRQS